MKAAIIWAIRNVAKWHIKKEYFRVMPSGCGLWFDDLECMNNKLSSCLINEGDKHLFTKQTE